MHCGIQFLKSHGVCIQTTVVCMKIPTHMMTLASEFKQMMGVRGGGLTPGRGCKGACLENCSGLCCGPRWILDYNLCEKIWQYECIHDKAYFNVLFVSEYIIVNGYHIWKWQFRCCKCLLWHSLILNFVTKNKWKKSNLWRATCSKYYIHVVHGALLFWLCYSSNIAIHLASNMFHIKLNRSSLMLCAWET